MREAEEGSVEGVRGDIGTFDSCGGLLRVDLDEAGKSESTVGDETAPSNAV